MASDRPAMDVMNDLPPQASARFIRRLAICMTLMPALVIVACDHDAGSGPEDARSASENVGWAGYNNGYHGQRFAALDQINTRNVAQLKSVCELKLGEEGPFQTGPVVIGDTMSHHGAHDGRDERHHVRREMAARRLQRVAGSHLGESRRCLPRRPPLSRLAGRATGRLGCDLGQGALGT